MPKKKCKKKFNSKFYNCSYYSLVSVSKIPDDTLVSCKIYGEIQKELVKELENEFEFQPSYSDRDFPGIRFSVSGAIEKKNINKMRAWLKEKGCQLRYDRLKYMHFKIPEGYLYSGWKSGRKTKIKPEDLPKSYVYLSNYKKEGYLETAGIVDVIYKPSLFHNHAFKDDFLYISYTKEFPEQEEFPFQQFDECDEYVFGNDILTVVKGIEKNNPESNPLLEKIKDIKSRMVNQYNAYVDEMGETFGRKKEYVKDFSELE